MDALTIEQLQQLNQHVDDLKENFDDSSKANEILNQMLEVMGEKPMFTSLEEFCEFMDSDEPLVL